MAKACNDERTKSAHKRDAVQRAKYQEDLNMRLNQEEMNRMSADDQERYRKDTEFKYRQELLDQMNAKTKSRTEAENRARVQAEEKLRWLDENQRCAAEEEEANRRAKLEDGRRQIDVINQESNQKDKIRRAQLEEERRLREQNEEHLAGEYDYFNNAKRSQQNNLKRDLEAQMNDRTKSAEKARLHHLDEGENMKVYWEQQNMMLSEQEKMDRMNKVKEAQDNADARECYVKNRLNDERDRKAREREERLQVEGAYIHEQEYMDAQKRAQQAEMISDLQNQIISKEEYERKVKIMEESWRVSPDNRACHEEGFECSGCVKKYPSNHHKYPRHMLSKKHHQHSPKKKGQSYSAKYEESKSHTKVAPEKRHY